MGAALDKRLKVVSDQVFEKDKEDSFCNPELDRFLTLNRINRLLVVGLDAAYCVNSTIKAAQNRGYEIAVITDAVISETDEMKARMLKEFENRKVELLKADEFLNRVKL